MKDKNIFIGCITLSIFLLIMKFVFRMHISFMDALIPLIVYCGFKVINYLSLIS